MNKTKKSATEKKRQERLERNRARTHKHVQKLLDRITDGSDSGFNHFGWVDAANAYSQVSQFLSLEEYQAVGRAWSDTYASDGSVNNVGAVVDLIKSRFSK